MRNKCACGKELHYADNAKFRRIEAIVAEMGEHIIVIGPDNIKYKVQRHYIALHSLRPADLAKLAQKGIVEVIGMVDDREKLCLQART